jgi:serine/threonine-protein kinase
MSEPTHSEPSPTLDYRPTPDAPPTAVPPTDAVGSPTMTRVAGAGDAATVPAAADTARYHPVRFHAKGGLGEIHIAEDAELRRPVALKRMQTQHAANPDNRRRFLLEAEVTGRLEHPGVVPVYGLLPDASGQPCYAMRFVEGESLQDALERFHNAQAHGLQPAGFGSLSFRQLLGRFVAVCNTVAYAHSRGILHRDLKPANILLGRFGETLVVDWGLAKPFGPAEPDDTLPTLATAETAGGTQVGQAMGTPAYMSPEQAAGRWDVIGPASDVYGLGATLYCLLTGRAPFQEPSLTSLLAEVIAGDFPPPRRVRPGLPAALEAVCLKAMARQPAGRYASALALAADVEHWLADEPVTAYRESFPVRLARWRRRHRTLVAVAAVLLLTAVVGLTLGLFAVNYERRQTAAERDQKQQLLADLTREQEKTKAALAAEATARAQALAALRSVSDDVIEQRLARPGRLTDEDRAILHKMLQHYEGLAALRGDDAESRAIRAEGLGRVGWIRYRLGEYKEAEAAYRQALALRQPLAAEFPDRTDYRYDLAANHNNLGILFRATGRTREAEAEYQKALDLYQRLVDAEPARVEFRQDLTNVHNNRGLLWSQTNRPAAAEAEYRTAIRLRQQLAADFPQRPEFRYQLARAYSNLGVLRHSLGRPTEAETAFRDALGLLTQLLAAFPSQPEYRHVLATCHSNLGLVFEATGRPQEAEASHRESLRLRQQLVAEFPSRPDYRASLATSHSNLGVFLAKLGRRQEAEAAHRTALGLRERLAADVLENPDYRADVAASQEYLGGVLRHAGRPREAEAAYRAALEVRSRLAAEFPTRPGYRSDLADTQNSLGVLLSDTGRPQEAEETYRTALALRRRLAEEQPGVPDHRNDVAGSLVNLALLRRDRGDFAGARQLLEEARPHHQAALQANPRNPSYRGYYRNNLHALVQTLAGLRDPAAAQEAAARLRELAWDPARDAYEAATALAQCIPIVEKDTGLSADERRRQAQAYADQVMAMLRHAVTNGYTNAGRLRNDTDLDPLRQRQDFQKLLADQDAKSQPGR